MDVRCENCGTEYELDEERLKPGGVTVQCANCGHTFKVGRRMPTALGVGPQVRPGSPSGDWSDQQGQAPDARQPGARAGSPVGQGAGHGDTPGDGTPLGPMAISPSGSRGKERNWLIRLPSGQIETCRELATLQQWIVAGKVTRHSGISRTGKTWKRLGDIRELASFFEIADEARRAAGQGYPGEPGARPDPASTLLGVPVAQHAGRGSAPVIVERGTSSPVPVTDRSSGPITNPPAAPVAETDAATGTEAVAETAAAPAEPAGKADPARPKHVFAHAAAASEGDAWRGSLRTAKAGGEDGPRGPTGGLSRHGGARNAQDVQDVAFTGGRIRPRGDMDDRAGPPLPEEADDALPVEPRGGAGRWLVLLSLVLMAGAATVAYRFVFRDGGFLPMTDPSAALDAGPDATTGIPDASADAAVDAGPALNSEQQATLAAVDERIAANTRAGLEAMEGELDAIAEATAGADEILALLVTRARVHTALAQLSFDEAAALVDKGDEAASRRVRRQGDERVLAALPLAQKALRLDRQDAGALVVMADIVRLQGRSATQVNGYLDQVLAQDPAHHEARLVRALALAGSGNVADEKAARALLTELAARKDDVRPLYRLALLDLRTQRFDEAEEHTAQVIAAQPTHEGALALSERIRAAMAVDASDPMPPEEGASGSETPGGSADESNSGAGSDGDEDDRDRRGRDSYDSLLARALRKQKAGDCTEALALFERAIDSNPIGVEALTGMGYCHIERREFASAHGKFRAALGVSPRNQDAIWGLATSYDQQGLKAQALQWYQRYLDEHPNGSRAAKARRQIERLGGGTDAPAPGGDPDETPAPPASPVDDTAGEAEDTSGSDEAPSAAEQR